ncbi:MAG: rRNA maturation RNase YbeY [Actinomycetota bacterium]
MTDAVQPVEVIVTDDRAAADRADPPVDLARWQRLAAKVASDVGGRGELTLTFVAPEAIAEINAEWMGADRPTDVLAAPMDAVDGTAALEDSVPRLLGDIVVCPAVADDQFATHAGTLDDELALLVVHGVLHVFGHDHAGADEAAAMRAEERRLLERFHWNGAAPPQFQQQHNDER